MSMQLINYCFINFEVHIVNNHCLWLLLIYTAKLVASISLIIHESIACITRDYKLMFH